MKQIIHEKLTFETLTEDQLLLSTNFGKAIMLEKGAEISSLKNVAEGKLFQDILTGKLAEFAASNYLLANGLVKELLAPDLTIRTGDQQKSVGYDHDLLNEDFKIHVKSCREDSSFPESYLFNKNDPVTFAKTFDDSEFVVFLVQKNASFAVRAVLPARFLIEESLYGPCLKPEFAKTKRCVYYSWLQDRLATKTEESK